MEEGLWFKQSSVTACNQQLSRGAAAVIFSNFGVPKLVRD